MTEPNFCNIPLSPDGMQLVQEKISTLSNENKILQQKLNSKAEALLILSKEVDKVRQECDDYKNLTETLQRKCSSLKSAAANSAITGISRSYQDRTLSKKFSDLRSENKKLLQERERLRTLLSDREEDVKAIRCQLAQETTQQYQKDSKEQSESQKELERIQVITKLESLQLRYSNLRQDLQVKY